ncbi:hypothetical protein Tcan_02859 [Toxocara canis]|uniref:Uncharacterized protein n=1 Tax=Toxocara canis TaxID=6265 RepID=A0A0B2V4T9_TOXCA|nr:hypothetical protein Tcan_02859 [Toxocara canis]
MIVRLLLKRAASVRACPADSLNVVRISRSPLSSSTSTSSESRKIGQQGAKDRSTHEDDRKRRKRYALGGCLVTMFFSTHAILLWRRRSEFRTLNKILPPVDWENFANEYLVKGRLKSIVYQPHFHVGDAYLHCSEEDEREKLKKHFLSTFRAGPEKFARTPDVRFRFDGDSDALELAIKKTLGDARKSCDIHLEINRFPSYRCLLRFDMEFDNPSAFNWSLEVEWIIRFYSSDFEHTWMEAPVKQHFSSDDPCRNLIWFPASICTERRYVNDDDVMVVGFDLRFKANKMDIRFTQDECQSAIFQGETSEEPSRLVE